MKISDEELEKILADNPDLEIMPEGRVDGRILAKRGMLQILDMPKLKNPVSKYKAQRTSYNGKSYPSKKQARKAKELELLKQVGKIKGYIEEVAFRLPGNSVHRVDFGRIELDDKVTWVETKGRDLPMGRLKRRQVEELYHIHIIVE